MKKGFFTLNINRLGLVPNDSRDIIGEPNCNECRLYLGCKSPKMEVSGKGEKNCLIIAECPGKEEDEQGIQLVGKTGILFRKKLDQYGLELDRDFYKINAINCWAHTKSGTNRTPTSEEINYCRPNILKEIEKLKPKTIWLLGECAIESLFGRRFKAEHLGVGIWRKRCIPDQKYKANIIPLYHPAFLLHNQDEILNSVYDLDLKFAVSCLDKIFRESNEPEIKIITDFNELILLLQSLKRDTIISYDYETNALKPFIDKAKILTIAFSFDENIVYSFPLYHSNIWSNMQLKEIINCWLQILKNENIKKIVQNIKFEEFWNRKFFNTECTGYIWDTMVCSHLLDEGRGGTTSLTLQSYFHFGIEDYESHLNKYKNDSRDNINRLGEVPIEILCKYNALDALYTYRIYLDQSKEIARKRDLQKAWKLSFDGLLAFADTEEQGLTIDTNYYTEQNKLLQNEMEKIEQELLGSEEAKKFKSHLGHDLNINSPKDLQDLFFGILGLTPIRKNKTGYSVDESVLIKLNHPFANRILEIRKISKIRGTYLAQFLRCYGDKLFPTINLHIVRTFRSSYTDPNFQNIPRKDKRANKICRGGIIPEKGHGLVDFDYKGAEVRAMACLSHDPALIDYITDITTDMHRDEACDIFFLEKENVIKELRDMAKNSFVFAEFYGDYYVHAAQNIWEEISEENLKLKSGRTILNHLGSKGIQNYRDFEKHMEKVEYKFWSRLKATDIWRKGPIVEYYKDRGYATMPTGYRRGGFLNRKQLMNTPVQNTAFCWLLWSYTRINETRRKEGWRSKLLGQIHDCIVVQYHPDEYIHILKTIIRIMTKDIREEFDWIITPLDVEVEVADIDQPWTSKRELTEKELEGVI